jgi:SAM-dependent methyltransferase
MSEVIYLSESAAVHMSDEWFDIAHGEHFWIKRRFDVLSKLARGLELQNKHVGEIGCGNGLVQQQFAEHYGVTVDGFDLNEYALRNSVATDQPRYCYDIFDCNPQFAARYDVLVLFDVIEHIEQEKPFLERVLYHLKEGGLLLINVPAFMAFHSRYDEVVGHQRRYNFATLENACSAVGLQRVTRTYWGLPMVPLLLLRKLWVKGQTSPRVVTRRGYDPPGRVASYCLSVGAKWEPIPQRLLGTSIMAIYRNAHSRRPR